MLGDIQRERQRHSQGVKLTLQREHAWEYADPYPVPLSNGNGSRVTAGLLVHNHLDATPGHDNFVEVTAADAPGDLPARLWIQLKHIHKSGAVLGSVWIHQLVENLAASLPNVLEGEAATAGSGVTRTLLTSATYSGGGAARPGLVCQQCRNRVGPLEYQQLLPGLGGQQTLAADPALCRRAGN